MAFGWEKKSEDGKGGGCGYGMLVVAFAVYIFISWIVSSAMEAKTYTRLTGREISTWDAMWVQLRVQAPPKQDEQAQ